MPGSVRPRKEPETDQTRLKEIPLFASLTDRELRRLARYVGDKEIEAGGYLVEQGEFSWAFFMIVEGEAEVIRDGEHLATLGPGDFLGETGVMRRARRNASVVATCDLTVAYLTARALRSVLRKTPSLSATLERAIEERSRILVA